MDKFFNLKCNNCSNPINVAKEKVTLSFFRKDDSDYDIYVASKSGLLTKDKADILTKSTKDIKIELDLSEFYGLSRIYWAVKDSKGNFESAYFEWTDTLTDADWVMHPLNLNSIVRFKKEFTVKKDLLKSKIYVCGLGYYNVFVNGVKIDEKFYRPNYTNYSLRTDKRITSGTDFYALYNAFDISKFVKSGKNVLEIEVSSGYYHNVDKDDDPEFCKVSFGRMTAIYKVVNFYEGFTEEFLSNKEDRCLDTKQISMLFVGDRINFNLQEKDYGKVLTVPYKNKNINLKPTDYTGDSFNEVFHPALISHSNGEYVYDFGQNHTGGLDLSVKGPKNCKVKIRFSEFMNSDGTLNYESSSYNYYLSQEYFCQENEYVLSGKKDRIKPLYNWRCYRYISITFDKPIKIYDIKSYFIHTDLEVDSEFNCSEGLFNEIYQKYLYTQLCNMHSGVVIDCPHREKLPYTGDGQIISKTCLYSFNSERIFADWIKIINGCQREDGFVPNTCPDSSGGGGYFWGYAIVEIPFELYSLTGNENYLKESLPYIKKWIDYLSTRHNGNYLLDINDRRWALSDWLSPDPQETDIVFFDSVCYYASISKYCDFYKIIYGKEDSKYVDLKDNVKKAINDKYLNGDYTYSKDKQGETALALFYGITEEKDKEKVALAVKKHYENNNFHFDTGIVLTPIVANVLSEYGFSDVVYKMMTKKDYPSFYLMLKDETTIPEHWSKKWISHKISEYEDIETLGGGDVSHCHSMFGSIVSWLFESVAGLNLTKLYDKTVIFSPKLIKKVSNAYSSKMINGEKCFIEYTNNGSLVLKINVPFGYKGLIDVKDLKGTFTVNGEEREFVNGLYLEVDGGEYLIGEKNSNI